MTGAHATAWPTAVDSKKLKVNNLHGYYLLPVVVFGCETWSFYMMEEQRLRVCENKVLKKKGYLGLRETKLQENGDSYLMLSYMHYIFRLI